MDRRFSPLLIVALIAVLAGAGYLIWQNMGQEEQGPETIASLGLTPSEEKERSVLEGIRGGVRDITGGGSSNSDAPPAGTTPDAGTGTSTGGGPAPSGGDEPASSGGGSTVVPNADAGGSTSDGDPGVGPGAGGSGGVGGELPPPVVGGGDYEAPEGVRPDDVTIDGPNVGDGSSRGVVDLPGRSSATGSGATGSAIGAGDHTGLNRGVWYSNPGCVYTLNGRASAAVNGGLNLVEINSGDTFGASCTWKPGYPALASSSAPYGTHVVGKTMAPGTWKPSNANCIWSLQTNLRAGGTVSGSDSYTTSGESVSLQTGDIFLSGATCGGWSKA